MLIVQGTLESPLIVCGLSDTLRESPNVEETRNQMQSSGWKKYTHFSPTNVHARVHPELEPSRLLTVAAYHNAIVPCDSHIF